MPDFMDHVQERVLQQQQDQVAEIERRLTGGLAECMECGDAITELRRSLGARRCLACQRAEEARPHR